MYSSSRNQFIALSMLPLLLAACGSAPDAASAQTEQSAQALENVGSLENKQDRSDSSERDSERSSDEDDDADDSQAGAGSVAPAVSAAAPYSIRVWAPAPSDATSLDAIESDGSHLWAGYQNNTTKDGSNGGPGTVKDSTIIEYSLRNAEPLRRYSLTGHVDGIRVEPRTGLIWATSNEDGSPHLFRINPRSHSVEEIALPAMPQGGGLDDLGFFHGKMFVAASAPQNDPNIDPALLEVSILGNAASFSPALLGNEVAKDYDTGADVALNLLDPDSISFTNHGELVLSSQDDDQLVFVKDPGSAAHSVRVLNVADKIDDTVWATERHGRLMVADGNSNIIFSIRKRGGFHEGDVYTEVDHHAVLSPLVGSLALSTGVITPVATGPALTNPTGLIFVSRR